MSSFRSHSVLKLVRGIKAFVNLDVGITRAPVPGHWVLEDRLAEKERELARTRSIVAQQRKAIRNRGRRVRALEARLESRALGGGGIDPEKVVWIFGNGRSGSTWLSRMMGEVRDHTVWFEPSVGDLFGSFYYERARLAQRESKIFILGDRQRETWLRSIRNFVLDGANDRFPGARKGGYLIVKEPHGSVGAPLLMEALPESRMVLLIRDPRDVVASALDAFKRGSWAYEQQRHEDNTEKLAMANESPDDFVETRALSYLRGVGRAKEAYEAHEGRKTLVRYEELRADTLGAMSDIYSSLEIDVTGEELARAVAKHSWENIPEKERGPGKFYRKASPGSWREDLTAQQANTIERITAALLEEFYPARETGAARTGNFVERSSRGAGFR